MRSNKLKTEINDVFLAVSQSMQDSLNREGFAISIEKAARLLANSKGRVIATGMGKSGLIARKVAATLTSTGTPAVFLHPADALHGDVGNVQSGEIVLAFSNSGETRELIELLPHIRRLGSQLVAVTGQSNSTLTSEADVAIPYQVEKEGCPLELAPMASTTISLVIGDALAAALISLKGFRKDDFGKYHPSGSLGRKLLTRVSDVMQAETTAWINRNTGFKSILQSLVSSNLGCVLVLGSKGHVRGIISDGDLKRLLDKTDISKLWELTANELMSANPVCIAETELIETALHLMSEKKIYTLPVLDANKKPVGIVRMHDVI